MSVIVPVYNDARRIVTCLAALERQTYPRTSYEVIVVDNGSTDGTPEAVAPHPVTLLVEGRIRSSYAARNMGLGHARGELIALTDADCDPAPEWLEESVQALLAREADLAGGVVRFVYSPRPSGAEFVDAVTNMQQEWSIRERGAAKTANLIARARVFHAIGPFPTTMRSGGDVSWTRRATSLGYRLVYAPRAIVAHPTRRLLALLGKQYRVGLGQYDLWLEERAMAVRPARDGSNPTASPVWRWRSVAPMPMALLRDRLAQHGIPAGPGRLLRVWVAAWLCRLATVLGHVSAAASRVGRHPCA